MAYPGLKLPIYLFQRLTFMRGGFARVISLPVKGKENNMTCFAHKSSELSSLSCNKLNPYYVTGFTDGLVFWGY